MTTLLQAVALVAASQNFPGLGFKSAADLAHIPRSSMRYARMAYESGLISAVCFGVIGDQRVVGTLHALPPVVCATVGRIETKLRRHLDRNRAAQIVWHFKMQYRMRKIEEMLDRSVPKFILKETEHA